MTIVNNILNQGLGFYDAVRELDNHVDNTNDTGEQVEMVLTDGSIAMVWFRTNTITEG